LCGAGEFLENGCVRWEVNYSGWQLLLAECGQLVAQLKAGGVQSATVARVRLAARILAAVAGSCPDMAGRLDQLMQQLFSIVNKVTINLLGPKYENNRKQLLPVVFVNENISLIFPGYL
jgi:hypothetical protein